LIITSGPAIIATETEEHELPTGSVVLVPAGVAHLHASPTDRGAETIFITRTPYTTDVVSLSE
jgi:quercetin dioxygenase-like cupin family protein